MSYRKSAHALITVLFGILLVVGGPASAKPKFSAIAVDATTGKILFSRNADAQRFPASLTKMMTLYITFQELKSGHLKLHDRFTVSQHAASMQPSKLGLKPGATISVEDAIKALVTKSANDIAVTVAEGIGKTEYAFAKRMTRTARYLGMTRTRFRNASGLPDGQQVTTARDMATLGLRLQRDFPQYYTYFKTLKFQFKGRTYYNHNRLLGRYKGTDGIKTGYTRASGFNLVSSVHRNSRHVIGVVLGATSGRARNGYMMSMLTRTLKRMPRQKTTAIANFAGKPPGLVATPNPQLIANPPVPTPKPEVDTETVTDTATLQPEPKDTPGTTFLAVPAKPMVLDPVNQTAAVTPPEPQADPDTWSIQIGAYADEDEAKRRLSETLELGIAQLDGKAPFTVAFYKNEQLLYRARISGFDKQEARNTCRALKRKSISCFPLAPNG